MLGVHQPSRPPMQTFGPLAQAQRCVPVRSRNPPPASGAWQLELALPRLLSLAELPHAALHRRHRHRPITHLNPREFARVVAAARGARGRRVQIQSTTAVGVPASLTNTCLVHLLPRTQAFSTTYSRQGAAGQGRAALWAEQGQTRILKPTRHTHGQPTNGEI